MNVAALAAAGISVLIIRGISALIIMNRP